MKPLAALIAILLIASPLTAQSLAPVVLSPGGSESAAGSIRLSFSLGQTATASTAAGATLLTQGFHQPEPAVLAREDGPAAAAAPIQALYPNPTAGRLTLEADFRQPGQVRLAIVDLQGRVLRQLPARQTGNGYLRHAFRAGELALGTYVLRIVFAPRRGASAVHHLRFTKIQ